jgi:hypothetical protein
MASGRGNLDEIERRIVQPEGSEHNMTRPCLVEEEDGEDEFGSYLPFFTLTHKLPLVTRLFPI